MTQFITNSVLAIILISLVGISVVTFMMDHDDFYGVQVPTEYQDAFNNYDELQDEYADVQQTVQQGEVDDASSDFAVFTAAITGVRQLGNIGSFANSVLNDLADFLNIPTYWINGIFLMLAVMITVSIIAFFTRGALP